ncbi:MAG: TonB C-terminal domain-containing protein [Bdellovibrionales bacterium]|nr:TonB C-terminal domain-containing protein [Bdellovibrionales bacterium]
MQILVVQSVFADPTPVPLSSPKTPMMRPQRRLGGALRSPEWFLYKDKLVAHIKQHWVWQELEPPLVAVVQVNISRTGEITAVSVERKSGNKAYDEAVEKAVWDANPAPPAIPELYDDFKVVRIEFNSAS